jgi:hypothetical protein
MLKPFSLSMLVQHPTGTVSFCRREAAWLAFLEKKTIRSAKHIQLRKGKDKNNSFSDK